GRIEIDGREVSIDNPLDSQSIGISIIYQEFNLVPALTVRENVFLGQEPARLSIIPVEKERSRARELFKRLGMNVNPDALVRDLTVAEQQVVEIAKALATDARIIVMDEPTAALSPKEVDGLFAMIRDLRSQGIGIIYVSHRLVEIFEIADRVTVLRDGGLVGTERIADLTRESMIEMMVGRRLENEFPSRSAQAEFESGDTVNSGLTVKNLCRAGAVQNVSLHVRRGEIVALTGLIGAGRTETARMIFGADRRDSGEVSLDGRPLLINRPRDAIAAGICLLTEDRKHQGLVLQRSVIENFGLPNISRFARWCWIDQKRERSRFDHFTSQLRIKVASHSQRAENLSGGNQQKVVLAKWLERNAEVIIFDEPTRGIDVGAKYEIYALINELAAQGKAILMISSELPEVIGMADRILVMHEGRVTGEISEGRRATQEQIMDLAVQSNSRSV
ncbi:MAG: sugar ABC transporter ATP-binding protein, partial [Planctomycetaceae bacterium]